MAMVETRPAAPVVRAPAPPPGLAERAAVQAIVEGRHGDPFSVLGMHGGGAQPLNVRTIQPGATAVAVLEGSAVIVELDLTHPAGFYEGAVPRRTAPFAYRLRVTDAAGTRDVDDAYRFPPLLGDMDVYLLAEGTHLSLYERLGAHPCTLDGVAGTGFAVWAPNASRVSVVGGFNGWDGRRHSMRKRVECGVWELFVPGIGRGEVYKYELLDGGGTLLPLKADPVALAAELPPATGSVVHGLADHAFQDDAWRERRGLGDPRAKPISIYECHLGSWRRVPEEGDRKLSWDELAERLIPYVIDLGFTHLELLPVSEFPFDGSWGYQPVGLFAPTSRFGDPEGFARFIDRCHAAGLGVLLDWVPGHFPTDQHGLAQFDGTALYEHADPRQGFQPDWNTLVYNFGRREVANFLLSNALYWLDRFHLDGLRVDAVASMLYLDYSRKAGEWLPNAHGGRENLEAVALFRRLNELAYGRHPGTMTVAEESTAWPAVSRPTYLGGLGFGFKWNMGWMHDTLHYMQRDPVYRRFHLGDLTFGLLYAYSENFVLPLSHDEVVHGKGSLINKMPGDVWQKFANLRAYYAFMWTHPGKKLLFMGGEFGQWREWNHDRSLDWHLLHEGPFHHGLHGLVRDLNAAYRQLPALHERDCEPEGFAWIDASDAEACVVAYLRRGFDADALTVTVCNFTPVPRSGYRVGVPRAGLWHERINTDAVAYGGSGVGNWGAVNAEWTPAHGQPASVLLTLPPLATLVLEFAPQG